jgi:putative DNA primase/helicase
MDIRTLAHTLGGDVTGRNTANVPGPGHSPKDRSLSIKLDRRAPGGFVVYSFGGNDPIECRDYIRGRLGLAQWTPSNRRAPLVVTEAGPDHDKERFKLLALRIWNEATDPRGTIVQHYLSEHRGLALPADVAVSSIRFHGALYFDKHTRHPGMVCLLRDISTNEPCGIHRTFLDRSTAQKIDRKMLGIAKDAAIKFDAPSEGLTIGEGVETVLAAREAGHRPAWALGSSGAIRSFPVLQKLSELTLIQDNDPAGKASVGACAKRYLEARRPVNIVKPTIGNDFNDAWRARNEVGLC